jgi:hypothetical protein
MVHRIAKEAEVTDEILVEEDSAKRRCTDAQLLSPPSSIVMLGRKVPRGLGIEIKSIQPDAPRVSPEQIEEHICACECLSHRQGDPRG